MGIQPQIGQIVKVLRGKEEGSLAVVIRIEDDRFVWIADGDKRRFDHPKKKNVLHLELQEAVSSEVVNSMNETGRVTNAKLRYAIQKFAYAKGD
ncbi:KOW motif-containing protein [Paenibacillus thailandensis]|uniref:KOW motif-containing protein n=1 Tax=Paenibacillus thailandensis TaxID=393250 RepID=A0ABW5R3V4_9BACL